ncbi:hypothetical protein [Marinobacter salarius]|uniref:Uncharacterized protein n=1 Tax=Marinobacter salarius TaxID=1420917 RepID=A0A1W6KFX7_9GAMM|nr:hypothetical protein [Marinobacter salarius]ARM86310.1 hypothetical protein MARSALSMR5_04293 [Marinobacter salarius]
MKSTTPQTNKSVWEKRLGWRFAQVYVALIGAFILPATAHAKLSDWLVSLGEEFGIGIPIVIVILGAVGVALAGFGILSAVMAKKNQRPLEHQGWFIVGGVLLVLLIPFVAGLGESISGEDAESAVQGVLGGT